MDEINEIITRSKKKIMRSLGIIKKAKINNFSSIKKNMGKKPSNKDKDNDIIINLDINEISTILNQKSPRKNKIVTKKKSSNPKTIVSSLPKKLKVISNEEKKEMIKKYGGYYDENDNFIIDYNSDIESDKDLENNIIKKDYFEKFTEEELKYWNKISKTEKQLLFKLEKELEKYEYNEEPERFRILKIPVNLAIKNNIMQKLLQVEMMEASDPEYFKLNRWLEGILKIPFGKYIHLPVSKNESKDKISKFVSKVSDDMNSSTFGHIEAKNKIMQIVCQWISNPKSMGNIIALQGPPGIGKTSLVRNGISKALNRPFHMIALGGATDSTVLEGHGYTYEGSTWGRIANILMESKVMNPIIFFDELDKVSGTKHGEEIIGVLTHLTDQTQNSAFNDKYFSGIELDLSRCLFVFSYNDESAINPILKDRLIRINLEGFSCDEKISIAQNYILKDLVDNIGMNPGDVIFPDEILKKIINEYTSEEGVRNLRRCLETILLKLNMAKYTTIGNEVKNLSFPVVMNDGLVKTLLSDKLKSNDFSDVSRKMMYI
jgi:ATP-dependent Lon protease